MAGRITESSSESWSRDVLEADGLVMVFFWADWCKPCHAMQPAVEELAEDFEDELHVVSVNVDDHVKVSNDYRVSIVPTVMFFRGGKKRHEAITLLSKRELKDLVESI